MTWYLDFYPRRKRQGVLLVVDNAILGEMNIEQARLWTRHEIDISINCSDYLSLSLFLFTASPPASLSLSFSLSEHQVRTVKFEGSTLTTDVTSGLWSCLKDFLMLDTLVISDSSLSFPPSPPELLSVTHLSAREWRHNATKECFHRYLEWEISMSLSMLQGRATLFRSPPHQAYESD